MKIKILLSCGLFAILTLCSCSGSNGSDDSNGSNSQAVPFQDSRDEQFYNTVKIGHQVWMAENLNYETDSGSRCYSDEPSNCEIYGRLYDWAAIMNLNDSCNTAICANQVQNVHQGICPLGFHVPSEEEWNVLIKFAGNSNAGAKLKSANEWNRDGNGSDTYGFSALPGGFYLSEYSYFSAINDLGYWWTTSENDKENAHNWFIRDYSSKVYLYSDTKSNGHSLRCIKD